MFKLPRPAALAAVLPLAGCIPATVPVGLVLPSDPNATVPPPRYATVTRGVKDFGVVETKDWLELNRQVAPKAGSGGTGGMPGMDGMGGKRDSGGR
ncbi:MULTISPECIES: hypothetical protein [unclassified Methylobacterium]|jgi:hypothetical protein|uniref:hypothetical protein n=1 Tax=unclassified Methylobacterium TaxID=2615210 RepID=UPI0006F686FD|nr:MULTISPECIES: hypothetical protein [unclassified Methylobacterium]KQO78304.1 hypothetical protein ASF20_11610 [Methylobacterium sp. Leaf88]KQT70409.1 hypothetical protein ASG51_13035 [Methylobacterium sp. Leaf465]